MLIDYWTKKQRITAGYITKNLRTKKCATLCAGAQCWIVRPVRNVHVHIVWLKATLPLLEIVIEMMTTKLMSNREIPARSHRMTLGRRKTQVPLIVCLSV